MIESFADKGTSDIWNGLNSPEARSLLPKTLWAIAARKLDMIHAAHAPIDLRLPPGNRLESLKGNLAGRFSIRINDQYRIVFDFEGSSARNVQIIDYH